MFRSAASLALTFLFATTVTTFAAEGQNQVDQSTTPIGAATARAVRNTEPVTTLWTLSQTPKRPLALSALYGSYAGLQTMDVISTRKAISVGATEQNPLMGSGGVGAMVAVKAVAGLSTIYMSEKLWKKNRVGAIFLMAALNGVQAAVVAHNFGNARR
jgi:hypothetical protein